MDSRGSKSHQFDGLGGDRVGISEKNIKTELFSSPPLPFSSFPLSASLSLPFLPLPFLSFPFLSLPFLSLIIQLTKHMVTDSLQVPHRERLYIDVWKNWKRNIHTYRVPENLYV